MMRMNGQGLLLASACLLFGALRSDAQSLFPMQDMDDHSLGLSYTYGKIGQDITEAATPSHESLHLVSIGYAGIPFLGLEAGMALSRFSVEPSGQTRFRGGFAMAPALAITGYTPKFAADMLRGTLGVRTHYLNSEDGRGFSYSALVIKPGIGMLISPTRFVDLALGGRLHLMEGTMASTRPRSESAFANSEIFRGYLSFTLKTPYESAFLNIDLDLSTQTDSDWSNGPREAAIGISFGAILGWKAKSPPQEKPALPTYFPAYPEMKDRQEKMAEELE